MKPPVDTWRCFQANPGLSISVGEASGSVGQGKEWGMEIATWPSSRGLGSGNGWFCLSRPRTMDEIPGF